MFVFLVNSFLWDLLGIPSNANLLPFSIIIIDLEVIQEAVSVPVLPRILIVLISLEIIGTHSVRPAAIISSSNAK